MIERKRTLVLEVKGGLAQPETLALEEGREVAPTSVGSDGGWRVEGEGVREVHAFVYFDGGTLFVQSAEAADPARADGQPLPAEWTAVRPPASITLGRVAILYRSLSDTFDDVTDAKTTLDAPAFPKTKPPRPFAPGAFSRGVDEEATRMEPVRSQVTFPKGPALRPPDDEPTRIEPAVALGVAPPPVAPTAVSPPAEALPPRASAPPPIDVPPAAPRPAAAPAPGQERGLAAQWRAASGPKKALVLLLPLLVASVWVIFRDEPEPPAPRASPSPSSAPAPAAPSPPPSSASAPPPPLSATTYAVPSPPRADAAAAPTERAAVDAVAAGAYAEAAALYEQLASAHPDHPAYAAAARVLRARLDSGR